MTFLKPSKTWPWFLLLVPFILIWPLFRGQVWAVGDLLEQFWPWKTLINQAVFSGRLPLWNSSVFCGYPLAGNLQSAPFYPVSFFFYFFSYGTAVSLFAASHALFAGLGMYLLCRSLGVPRPAALLGAVLFQVNPFMMHRLPMLSAYSSAAWTPWILFSILRRVPLRWTALLWACQLLTGYPLENIYTLIAVILLIAFRPESPGLPKSKRFDGLLFQLALPLALGAGLAAIQLLPGLETIAQSTRLSGVSKVATLEALNFSQMLTWVFPSLAQYHDDPWVFLFYPGILAWSLAGAAIFSGILRQRRAQWAAALFFTGLLLCFGAEHRLGFRLNRRPTMALTLLTLSFTVFVSIAAGQWKHWLRSWSGKAGASFIFLFIFFLGLWLKKYHLSATALFFGTAGWALMPKAMSGKRHALLTLLLLVTAEILFLAWIPPHRVNQNYYRPSKAMTFLKPRQDGGRFMLSPQVQNNVNFLGNSVTTAMRGYMQRLKANTASVIGLKDANGYDPLAPGRVVDWLNRAAFPIFNGKPEVMTLLGVSTLVDWDNEPSGKIKLQRRKVFLRSALVPEAAADFALGFKKMELDDSLLKKRVDLLVAYQREQPLNILENDPEHIQIQLPDKHLGGYVFLNDTWFPGWQAEVDGKRVHIKKALLAFRAVKVPANAHLVKMSYRPLSFYLGLSISLVVGLLMLTLPRNIFFRKTSSS